MTIWDRLRLLTFRDYLDIATASLLVFLGITVELWVKFPAPVTGVTCGLLAGHKITDMIHRVYRRREIKSIVHEVFQELFGPIPPPPPEKQPDNVLH